MSEDVKTDIALIQQKQKVIEEYLKKMVGFGDAILLIQEEVKGNKTFKQDFEANVIKIIKNELNQKDNLTALQEISDERIKQYINSTDFNNLVKQVAKEAIKNEIQDTQSPIHSSIMEIMDKRLLLRDRTIIIKTLTWLFGSVGTLFAIYKYLVGV